MSNAFTIILLILSVLLIGILLLQARGTAGQAFGQAESTFRSRRGVERLMFRATIVIAVLFITIAIVNVNVNN